MAAVFESNHGTIIIPYTVIETVNIDVDLIRNHHQKLSYQIAEPLSIIEISPNSMHVHASKTNQYMILI